MTSRISDKLSPASVETNQKASGFDELKRSWDSLVEGMSTLFKGAEVESLPATSSADTVYFDAMEGIPAEPIESASTTVN